MTEIINKIIPEKVPLETDQGILDSEEKKWLLPLKEVYKHGLAFYKDKDGKAVHLSYEDRLKLIAYTQQASHGPLDVSSAPPLGVLDMIGKDRRAAWLALGEMSQVQAMAGFVHTIDRLCPLFKPYIEAFQKDFENKMQLEQKKEDEEKALHELQSRVALEKQKQNTTQLTEEEQVQRVKDALNAQTYDQFLQYSQQQFPGNFDQQAILVRQLQDQHYQQYIQQCAVDQRLANSKILQGSELDQQLANSVKDAGVGTEKADSVPQRDCNLNDEVCGVDGQNKSMQTSEKTDADVTVDECKEEDSDDDGFPPIESPRMWTHGDLGAFRDTARAGGGRLVVGHGETVSVRVPTNAHARCLCWEFATDHYDIGFGVYFEWCKPQSSEVTIHVSDSDEEEDDDYAAEEYIAGGDAELGPGGEGAALTARRAPASEVVPVYRRDCYTEVYAGSHQYPGEGVYVLKFDNTYSLWRSKTLYYKVYYTQ